MASIAGDPLSGPAPVYTLFDAGAVATATFFGTPVAGGSLMALNYRRLGQAGKAVTTIVLAFAATAVVLLVGWNLPQKATLPIAFLLLLAMRGSAQSLQGSAVKDHVQRGGRLGSKKAALAVGMAFLAVVVAIVFIAVFVPEQIAKASSVTIGENNDIYYSGTATEADARALGNALRTSGYFNGSGADVFLAKGEKGTVVSFIVKDGIWEQPGKVATFEEIGREVAPTVGGFPIQVRLLNRLKEVQKESNVGRAQFPGNDDVYYFGSATQSQAEALGRQLQTAGFFGDKGYDVFLAKHSDGTTLSFVVHDGSWDDPAVLKNFENIVRGAAPAVGGLPVTLRLINPSLQPGKTEIVK